MQTFLKGLWYNAEYESFRVDSEANLYKLRVSGYRGNAGDSLANITSGLLTIQTGMNFSAYESDNDMNDVGSCSAIYNNAGWWFNDCSYSCLTCMNGLSNFAWYSLNTYGFQNQGRLRAARMMIRSL